MLIKSGYIWFHIKISFILLIDEITTEHMATITVHFGGWRLRFIFLKYIYGVFIFINS